MFTWLPVLGEWLYANTVGNLVAGFMQIGLIGIPVWIKKVGPHLRAQAAHRTAQTAGLADLHAKIDAIDQTGGQT